MHRVLIVDDEPSIRQLVQYNLSQAGFDVMTAESGAQVLPLVREQHPDLIVLDLMLPGLSGTEVCQQLRREGIDTPVIMLTAKDDEIDRILGLEMGADDYVTKPFSPANSWLASARCCGAPVRTADGLRTETSIRLAPSAWTFDSTRSPWMANRWT
ncbi:hypothetical protein GCM10025857_14180 [Alicyclobacillus contaminans]|nr:hypothetical protein GCM10025857_14180 [Alicyclobacillus contaminans]